MQKATRLAILIFVDVVLINASYLLSILIRFDFAPESTAFTTCLGGFFSCWFVLCLIKIALFYGFGMYSSLWKFAGAQDVLRVIGGVLFGSLAAGAVLLFLVKTSMPISIVIISFLLDILLIGGVRLLYRFTVDLLLAARKRFGSGIRRVMVVGSGYTAAALIKEMRVSSKGRDHYYVPAIVVDNSRNRQNKRIQGVRIGGTIKDIPRLARRYKIDEIFVSLPTGAHREIEAVGEECEKTSCGVRFLPPLRDIIDGKIKLNSEIKVNIEELLPHERLDLNEREIKACFKGRIVLVAGAGSHIGAEICRQVGDCFPRKIIALDSAEAGLLALRQELRAACPDVDVQTVICSTSDVRDVEEVFENVRPHIVIQAGNFVNSRLMEENAKETVKNNIFGTMRLINACEKYSAERFALISSIKAGSGDTVAGASARVMEMMIRMKSEDKSSKVVYTAVRLGSLLGTDGGDVSVIRSQIEKGGPVEIAHENQEKLLMSGVPAAQLVLQAVSEAQGGEIFGVVLGQRFNMLYLAEEMIRLWGLKPYDDIDIVLTGTDPGEKLEEAELAETETVRETKSKRLVLIEGEIGDFDEIQKNLSNLWTAVQTGDNMRVKRQLSNLVPEYTAVN